MSTWSRLRTVTLAGAVVALAACGAFHGKRVVNMAPFAENTLVLVSDLHLSTPQPVYVRAFMVRHPDVVTARETGSHIRDLIRGIVFYSLQVAAINSADLPERRKAEELARYLEQALRAAIRAQHVPIALSEAQLDSVLANVRAQETYLAALRAAEPIVSQVVQTADDVIGSFNASVRSAGAGVAADVERDFAPHRANLDGLRELEAGAVREYVLVSRARLGDSSAVAALGRATPEDLARRDREVTARLATIRELRQQLQPEADLYFNRMKELDAIIGGALATGRQARGAIVLWSRAHRNMAAGMTLPPEVDLVGALAGTVSRVPGM